jgi:hypothetical protein
MGFGLRQSTVSPTPEMLTQCENESKKKPLQQSATEVL